MDERLLAALAAYIDAHYEAEREIRRLHIDDLRTFAGSRPPSVDLDQWSAQKDGGFLFGAAPVSD